jgi:phage gp29-like protein
MMNKNVDVRKINGVPINLTPYRQLTSGFKPDVKGNKKSMKQVLATPLNAPDFIGTIDEVMANPEPLLMQDGRGYEIFDDVLADPFVYGCYDSRMNNMLSQEFVVIQKDSDSKQYEVIKKVVDDLLKQDILLKILEARFISPQPICVVWQDKDKLWLPDRIYSIPPERVVYTPPVDGIERELRVMTNDAMNTGIPVHPHNYLIAADGADSYVNPYGYSLLSKVYWLVVIMKHTMKFWSILTEDHGQPLIDAKFTEEFVRLVQKGDRNQDSGKIADALMETLKLMRQNRLLVHPDGTEIKIHEGITTSNSDVYNALITACKKMVSVLMLGHEGASMSTAGQLGENKTASQIRDDIRKADTLFVMRYVNILIDWMYYWNWNSDDKPVFTSPESYDVEQLTRKAQLFSIVRNELGRNLSDEYLSKELNIDIEQMEKMEIGIDLAESIRNESFSNSAGYLSNKATVEDETELLETFVQYLDDAETNDRMMSDMMKPLFKFVNEKDSLEEMEKNYHTVFDEMDDSSYFDRITRANFLSYLIGYWNSERAEQFMIDNENDLASYRKEYFNKEEPAITLSMLKFALDLEPEEAVKYFRPKGIEISADHIETIEAVKKHAFTVSGVMKLDILMDLKDMLTKALSNGWSRAQFRKEIKELMARKGWLGKVPDGKTGLQSPWRLNLIYHNNTRSALHDARWDQMMSSTDTIPYVLSVARMNGSHPNSTKQCKALHNKVFSKTDKYYQKYLRCQRHHYCYSTEVSISEKRRLELGLPVSKGTSFAQHKNMKGFYHEGPWQPELGKYPDVLVKRFKKRK